MTDDERDGVVERTGRWVDEAVVGLGLCPFAGSVVGAGRVHTAVHRVPDGDGAVRAALAELELLVNADPTRVATTLVVYPDSLGRFDDFLDVVDAVDQLLEESGADTVVQLASFHPHYRFADAPPDDLGNYTNRSPYPVIQLLRVADVAAAVAGHPDPLGIPAANVARLRGLGDAEIAKRWQRFKKL